MKRVISLIIKDIKLFYKAAIIIMLYLCLMEWCFHSTCLVRGLIGFPCPGCGMTRATVLLFTGHITEAMQMHPMVIAIIGWFLLFFYFRYIKEKRLPNWMLGLAIFIGISMIIFYLYRMMVYFPDCEPMNYNRENLLWKIKNMY